MMDYPLITYNYPLKNPAEASSFKKPQHSSFLILLIYFEFRTAKLFCACVQKMFFKTSKFYHPGG